MASIRRLQSGKWQVQIRVSGLRPLARSFESRASAQKWARQTETQLSEGDLGAGSDIRTKLAHTEDPKISACWGCTSRRARSRPRGTNPQWGKRRFAPFRPAAASYDFYALRPSTGPRKDSSAPPISPIRLAGTLNAFNVVTKCPATMSKCSSPSFNSWKYFLWAVRIYAAALGALPSIS